MSALNNKVSSIHRTKHKGEVGIEIEVEGNNLPEHIEWWWKIVPDGSLRDGGYEFILKKPVIRSSVPKTLKVLNKAFIDHKTKPIWSQRTSVHVHINVQDMTFYETIKYAVMYYIFEDALLKNFNSTRQGNHFCLRLKDAMGVVSMLEDILKRGDFYGLDDGTWKYGALNLATIFKFGSLEFRAMEGNLNSPFIQEWIDVLLALKDSSLRYDTIEDILAAFSVDGVDTFTKKALSYGSSRRDLSTFVTKHPRWERDVMEGMWRIQSLGYIQEDTDHRGAPRKKKPKKFIIPPQPQQVQQQQPRLHGERVEVNAVDFDWRAVGFHPRGE